jgi:hypothetical protein
VPDKTHRERERPSENHRAAAATQGDLHQTRRGTGALPPPPPSSKSKIQPPPPTKPRPAAADDEPREPTTQELDVDDFLTEPNVRVPPPSSGPLDDERVAGMPLRPVSRWILLGAASLTAFVLVLAALKLARQPNESGDSTGKQTSEPSLSRQEGTASAAATSPPVLPTAVLTSAAPTTATPATPASSNVPARSVPVAHEPPPAPAAAAEPQVVSQPRPAVARAAPPPQEAPVVVPDRPADRGGGPLLAQASRALRDGSLVRAVELAREAVNASPGNADAWLTLGAAYQATGNTAAARDAYRSCVEKARTANVGECRVLAEH